MIQTRVALICVLLAGLMSNSANAQLTFNFTDGGGAGAGTQARAGFQEAANFWSSQFDDNIEVNIDIGFSSLAAGVLGSASSDFQLFSYDDFRTASTADATSANDQIYTSSLPSGSSFDVFINETTNNPNGPGSAIGYLDNSGGANNTTVQLNRANAKALGLITGNDSANDANITFSSDANFDFDRSDGIDPSQIDFVGLAIHEIGHALGFTSGVDALDFSPDTFPDDSFDFVSPLDFTRQSADSLAAGADFDFTVDDRPKFLSLDGGISSPLAGNDHFSLGQTTADGRQASHFRDGLGLGILDPTFSAGELGVFTENDRLAFDIIGFNSIVAVGVPEPGSATLLLAAMTAVGLVRRRK